MKNGQVRNNSYLLQKKKNYWAINEKENKKWHKNDTGTQNYTTHVAYEHKI